MTPFCLLDSRLKHENPLNSRDFHCIKILECLKYKNSPLPTQCAGGQQVACNLCFSNAIRPLGPGLTNHLGGYYPQGEFLAYQ